MAKAKKELFTDTERKEIVEAVMPSDEEQDKKLTLSNPGEPSERTIKTKIVKQGSFTIIYN